VVHDGAQHLRPQALPIGVAVWVTVMKSEPRNTRATPGRAKMRDASGLRIAASTPAKSAVPRSPITSRPGMNFRVAGLGVDSVSMNMASVPRQVSGPMWSPSGRGATGASGDPFQRVVVHGAGHDRHRHRDAAA
jgi:hypothetical protein